MFVKTMANKLYRYATDRRDRGAHRKMPSRREQHNFIASEEDAALSHSDELYGKRKLPKLSFVLSFSALQCCYRIFSG